MTTPLRTFGLLLSLCAAAPSVAGCASPADTGADSTSAIEASGDRLFRFRDAQNEGSWLFRIEEAGGALSGHMVLAAAEASGPGAPSGSIEGAIGRDGTYWMTWHLPDLGKGATRPITFEGKLERNGDLKGTMTPEGDAPKPVRLSTIRPGTLERNAPLFAQPREDITIDGCHVQVSGVELFALSKPEIERSINARLREARDRGRTLCGGGVRDVSGGPFVGVLRKDVLSWSSGFLLLAGDDERRVDAARVNVSLEDGEALSLFGDVLDRGRESVVADEIQKVIDELPGSHFVGRRPNEPAPQPDPADSMRAALKAAMRGVAERGELASLFLLVRGGISFETKGFDHPRISSVVVPYERLRAFMAPRGRARSVWEPATP